MLRFNCPTCKRSLSAPEEKAGEIVACPTCKKSLFIPTAAQIGTPAAPVRLESPPSSKPPTSTAQRLLLAGLACGALLAVGLVIWYLSDLFKNSKAMDAELEKNAKGHKELIEMAKGLLEEPSPPAKKRYARDEFKKAVIGKSKDEVLRLLGRPDQTQDVTGLGEYWYYKRITYDPVADKEDMRVQVKFTNGIVTSINFI